ncbi:hypothetical protein JNX00_02765 [Hydrogenophaga sp. YM1]|jgi:hypothetical protein|uniref:hypothetical protein n=1 Tax=Hydrogenophaga TaxID=47420 RepID=UPI00086AFFB4|nr:MULTISPECIES: hypothetical protein [unclassified Hydrogenophaga]MBN9371724.1 hypothetical protein [Hydrogenophaga sp.]ODT31231.1 MAG: hypothetical protein ABS53_11010 [Hydrogenophaga sp. SCN 70-13]OJV62222.1 MAG: hypothetical protein BGO22_12440 [Hydrogenophaga sp. 70-12]QRR34817.1 hypothetical protein JNX00_02765 [Hydrogenophaga sp. YM1]
MPTPRQIERFTLAFHREALQRVARSPELIDRALAVLDRWEASGLSNGSTPYREEWRQLLLARDVSRLTQAVCADGDHAATLRGMSPLGFVLPDEERQRLRREAMAQ